MNAETDAQIHDRWMLDYFRTARPDPERVIRWQPKAPADDLTDLLGET